MPVPPWQLNQQRSNFPIPPRNAGGILNPPSNQNRDLQNAQSIALYRPNLTDSPLRPLISKGGILDSNVGGKPGIIGNSPRGMGGPRPSFIGNSPRGLNNQTLGNSPRPLMNFQRGDGRPGILDKRTEEFGATARPGLLSRDRGDHQRNGQNEPPSLFNKIIPPPAPQGHKQNFSPKQNQNKNQSQNKNSPSTRSKNQKNEAVNKELEEKALKTDVSKEFFDRVKPLSNAQVANFVALEVAQKEFAASQNRKYTGKTSGLGHHMCNVCKINHLSYQKLQAHYKTSDHKELEELFNLKKEQVRLILSNKITGPTASESSSESEMVAIARAEVEMNLKPTEIDLDGYILGVYESIMKPYWPVPKSSYYCRICNYAEFRGERDLNDHKATREHQRREDNYQDAFCLYCQKHTGDVARMVEHEKDSQHLKVKDLMEKTKQCAIEHWHKVNKKEIPSKYVKSSSAKPSENIEDLAKHEPKVGSKRSAPDEDKGYTSPTKKVSGSSRDSVRDVQKNYSGKKSSSSSNLRDYTSSRENVDGKEKEGELSDNDKIWFAPIFGFICKACHKFLANAKEQKQHISDPAHSVAVAKFKKSIIG